jgi:SSS family solute:Na+ symporter
VVCGFETHYLTQIMTVLLVMVAIYTILGGMLSVLVTDFLQFVVMSAGLLAITILILYHIGWERLVATVEQYHGAGGFNPVINPQQGWAFILMQILGNTAATLTWQTTIARLLAAKDTDTGRRVYTQTSFFFVCRWLIPGLWGIAALATLGWQPLNELSPAERARIPEAAQVQIAQSKVGEPFSQLSAVDRAVIPANLQTRMEDASIHAMPRFLSTFVPIGLMGLLLAAMLAADMSTDSSYMLSWGSVIYNDILAPFRKRPWPDRKAILWNRFIVAGIGVYLFVFGLLYKVEGNIWSFLLLTGSIYLSSMSVLLVACCYWDRANDWGAFAAIVCGAVVPSAHLLMEKIPSTAELAARIGKDWAGIAAFVAAALGMVIGSLIKPQRMEVAA